MNEFATFAFDTSKLLNGSDQKGRYVHSLWPDSQCPHVIHKETNQLSCVLSGRGIAILDGITKSISEGDTIYVPAGAVHAFKTLDGELVLFHIHVPDTGRESDRLIVEGEDYDRFTI